MQMYVKEIWKYGKEAAEGVGAKALWDSGASAPAARPGADKTQGLRGGERLVPGLPQLMGRTFKFATLQARTWPQVLGGEGFRMELSREAAYWVTENHTGD
mmetsp:Transcript_55276/g.125657  ORF Transcript_55276/g.125657 Transcript_55276/m.125657 type:complete len:101 (-) Transcript_55276:731-1033(-)